jgi:hypothetical protein
MAVHIHCVIRPSTHHSAACLTWINVPICKMLSGPSWARLFRAPASRHFFAGRLSWWNAGFGELRPNGRRLNRVALPRAKGLVDAGSLSLRSPRSPEVVGEEEAPGIFRSGASAAISTVIEAGATAIRSAIRLTDPALDCVIGRAPVPGTPSSANRASIGCAVSTLHRPTTRAVIPSPSVTVAVVRWWGIVAVIRRSGQVILRLGGHECANRDRADKAAGQEDFRSHGLALHCATKTPDCFSLSRPPQ